MRKFKFLLAPVAAAVLSSMLGACAVGPNYTAPDTKVAEKFEGAQTATYSNEQTIARFWENFNDVTLDQLIKLSLAENHDLRIALTRVREARALTLPAAEIHDHV